MIQFIEDHVLLCHVFHRKCSQALVCLLPAFLARASSAVVLADARPAALLALVSFLTLGTLIKWLRHIDKV